MRLIDADALREQCDDPFWCVWLNEIDDAPTIDAVPVVRCKDCFMYENGICRYWNTLPLHNGYCHMGERKD